MLYNLQGGREDSADQPSDTMEERAAESTQFLWLLLDADRRVVAGVLSAVLFVAVVAAGLLHPGRHRRCARGATPSRRSIGRSSRAPAPA